ncbi:relaxase/mobilization nuclease domain-containing protein [Actinopolyspora halophila]|uniref:relaxase/mobilization nuclease domain-containing protein n=1 Tax=Actinopolyspora halophila TaxID=1850 RepID=UPI000371D1FA|nr:hypothetical protein [Actinopolyspora halophila]
MIAKSTGRGSRVRGLLEYLWGEGRANEHENPRIVAAWDATFVREPGATMDAFDRKLLAYEMEGPMRIAGIEPGQHVYHVPVSLHVDDGQLSDEQWRQMAEHAAEELGLTAGPRRSPAPWFAMRHGKGAGGQDHMHFVAVVYRESGHKASVHNDAYVWQTVRHAAEERWNLTRTRVRGGGVPDHKRGELERATREGREEPAKTILARTVRTAATAARDEADFVGRVRQSGVLIRPRWQSGGQQHAVGYSVALRPPQGAETVWYGGGKLADDLSLSALRAQWPEPSQDQRAEAVTAWLPASQRQAQRRQLQEQAWQAAADTTTEVRASMGRIAPEDEVTWSAVTRDAAGALGALAERVPPEQRQQLRRAASALGRSAQTDRRGYRGCRSAESSPLAGVVRTAADARQASRGGPYGAATLVMQLGRLVRSAESAYRSSGRAVQAARAASAAEDMLTYLQAVRPTQGVQPAQSLQHQVQQQPRKNRGGDDRER